MKVAYVTYQLLLVLFITSMLAFALSVSAFSKSFGIINHNNHYRSTSFLLYYQNIIKQRPLGTNNIVTATSSPTSKNSFTSHKLQHHQHHSSSFLRTSSTILRRNMASSTTIESTEDPITADGEIEKYDLVVIGGGSGGVRASRIASGYGAKTLLIETQLYHGQPNYSAIGGTCVNVGCVPKKLMVFASRYPKDISSATGYGWENVIVPNVFDWNKFIDLKNTEITRLNNVYQKNVLTSAGVNIIEGYGKLNGPNHVDITSPSDGTVIKTVSAKNIVIAVGGWPYKLNIPGAEYSITSNEIFYLPKQPKNVVVIGGGYIALEFATILNGMGSTVHVLYRGDLFLRGFDYDMRIHLKEEMERNTNIQLHFNTIPTEIIKNENEGDTESYTVITANGDKYVCDCILMATGRKGKIDTLNLASAGVQTTPDNSFIPVNEYSQTNIPNIYAVGDVTDRIALTPVALMEGHRLADTLYGNRDRPVDHEFVASTVFTNPEIATIGYTEEQAAEKFGDITIYKTKFRAMKHSFVGEQIYTLFKLIVDSKTDKVVGVHIASDNAGEMMQGIAIAVKMGATKADFDATIGIHPTSAEELVTMRTPSYHYKNGKKVE